MLVSRIMKLRAPAYLAGQFKAVESVASRTTRSSSKRFIVPIHRTVKFQKSFKIQASYVWNDLELYNLQSLSVSVIRNRVLKAIQHPSLYS